MWKTSVDYEILSKKNQVSKYFSSPRATLHLKTKEIE
jgi:hypothetical protein